MTDRGWETCDFIFVSGDAYVDHPSFAAALICRALEAEDYQVGIIPQPDWRDIDAFRLLGRPRLAFLVGSGAMDSMVAHYTAAKKPRSQDLYSPGGKIGLRPDRALIAYVPAIRAAYKQVPVIIGGIEASLRAFSHYDYWSDTVRRSILLDSKADMLVYGMGEAPIREIARRLALGEDIRAIRDVSGTCVAAGKADGSAAGNDACIYLPGYEAVKDTGPAALRAYAESFMLQRQNADPATAKVLVEAADGGRQVIRNPPARRLSQVEFDRVYELPFTRRSHPMYDAAGGIPALKEVEFSLTASRGCFGGCSFCAITGHQGRAVVARSRGSLVREARQLSALPGFKGYIHDVGGPTANFFGPACPRQETGSFCPDRECLYPEPCPKLNADHGPYLEALSALRKLPGIKKVFIRSGIRFDWILLDQTRGTAFLETLCRYHISGQLKVAPEHCSRQVLAAMGKNGAGIYELFRERYAAVNRALGLKQYLIPYYISAHPGAGLEEAVELALTLKKARFVPDQTQDFYPTPGTLSTVMYRTGLDPRTMEPLYVARGGRERRLQRALLQFNHPGAGSTVREALREAGREDLLGKL